MSDAPAPRADEPLTVNGRVSYNWYNYFIRLRDVTRSSAQMDDLAPVATSGRASDLTGLAEVAISGSASDLSGLAQVARTGDAGDLSGTLSAARLPASGVTAGTYPSPTVTVDAAGRVTAINSATGYEPVAASQTDQVMGTTGAAGDWLKHLVITPATTSPGAVSVTDGAGSPITVFAGGASSVADLTPFTVTLDMVAVTAWKVSTGADVSVGRFT